MIVVDGSYGEGGGQVLRTCLALSAVTGQPVRIEHIRAHRRKPGLQPQHLTGVRAVARVCHAQVEGARLDAQALTFTPGCSPQAGRYTFDVADAAKGGSAGSTSLVLHTVLVPLALANGASELTLRGGTHVAWSPPFDYLKRVYLPTLARAGIRAKVNLRQWGWFPLGGGEVKVTIQGCGTAGDRPQPVLEGLDLWERGELLRVRGISAASNLPKHIRARQAGAALGGLRAAGINARVDEVDADSKGQGTALFLWAESEQALAGFTSLGQRGKPAEEVAADAVTELLAYLESGAALDCHLADQLVLPLALASGPSRFTTERVTNHLLTSAWVVNLFFPRRVRVEGQEGSPGACYVEG
ncbi:MAG: RNA 3'-phosphate cyclase [Anaerolineae bacterium]|nr:RNA 3'-phosphate cyclase [Anaerolineae bacterium]